MSKFSPALRALIDAPHARQDVLRASPTIHNVYAGIAQDAAQRNVSVRTWLCLSTIDGIRLQTAATVTLNSPESLLRLHALATAPSTRHCLQPDIAADLMRETGLKCISFSGIPRTILSLTALAGLPKSSLSTATRSLSPANVTGVQARGDALWSSIYAPPHLAQRLTAKLASAHPNLPVVIQQGHYGQLLNDPEGVPSPIKLGRVLTSVVAVAGLRAQGGVGLQVTSHVRGLQNALAEAQGDAPERVLEVEPSEVEGVRWLGSDEGAVWLLESVDKIVASLVGAEGSRFGRSRL